MSDKWDGIENKLGVLYPKGFIVALIPGKDHAETASADLHAAGFADVRVFSPEEVLDRVSTIKSKQSLWQKIQIALAEEQMPADLFLEDVKKGAYTVMVHTEDKTTIEKAKPILKAHQAGKMGHYGEWTMEDLR